MSIHNPKLVGISLLLIVATVAPVGTVSAAPRVAALWHLDEAAGAGRMIDSSGNDNDGTLNKVESGLAGAPGFKLSYYFGRIGLPSLVEVPHSNTLNPGSEDITLSMYAKFPKAPPSAVGDYDMVRKGLSTTAGGDYKMEIFPKSTTSGIIGRGYCYFRGSNGKAKLTKGPDLSDDEWYFIQCRKTTTQVSLTIRSASGSFNRTWVRNVNIGSIANTAPLYVGAKSPAGEDQYTGAMDEVKILIGS